jgi:hypothetical protein
VRNWDGNLAEQQRLQGSVIYRAVIRVRVKQIFAVVPSLLEENHDESHEQLE